MERFFRSVNKKLVVGGAGGHCGKREAFSKRLWGSGQPQNNAASLAKTLQAVVHFSIRRVSVHSALPILKVPIRALNRSMRAHDSRTCVMTITHVRDHFLRRACDGFAQQAYSIDGNAFDPELRGAPRRLVICGHSGPIDTEST